MIDLPTDLYESTRFRFAQRRLISTNEPYPTPGPLFSLARSHAQLAWSIHASVPEATAAELAALAAQEPPTLSGAAPLHEARYLALLSGAIHQGPAFLFPKALGSPANIALLDDERLLQRHFRGWTPGEIAGRAPVVAALHEGAPVSVCFCARSSTSAAEAGVETAPAFRGRGLAPQVVAAWAIAVRASGRTPLYSTSRENHASLSVVRKLGLLRYADLWCVEPGR